MLRRARRASDARASRHVIFFPAIDLKDGKCVRLKLGDMSAATVFNDDPAAQARTFEDQGFKYLHIVDLNGAFAGKPVNGAAVDAILKAITIPVQLGGGIRDLETIETWLASGIARVILGTVAVRDPELVRRACANPRPHRRRHRCQGRQGRGRRLGRDVRADGRGAGQALRGRRRLRHHLHRHRARRHPEGAQPGATAKLARATRIPVIASGGLASIDDVKALLRPEYAMLEGAITGRALYDGRIDPKEALALMRRPERPEYSSHGTQPSTTLELRLS